MEFNRRTSVLVVNLARSVDYKLLHHRVLYAVFQEDWREKTHNALGSGHHAGDFRSLRSRQWCGAVKTFAFQSCRDEGQTRSSPGNFCEWEDVFVHVYGTNWRQYRDRHESKCGWIRRFQHFCNTVCCQWNLPRMRDAAAPAQDASIEASVKRARVFREVPTAHSDPPLSFQWEQCVRCFVFRVDCKPLQQLICGHSVLEGMLS